MRPFILHLIIIMVSFPAMGVAQSEPSAEKIVNDAFQYWRGQASTAVADMVIHRPSWERTMTVKAWTRGEKDALFVIIAPAKDNGNGTLKKGQNMWMYNPKVNRVIKLPPSMMAQAWQGSDFSNNDLAKTDSLITDYTHTLVSRSTQDGKTVYHIESIPKPDAPVIWGMIRLEIREDLILLAETFYDEERQPVKEMTATDIRMANDRLFPMTWTMEKSGVPDEYTRFTYRELTFSPTLDERFFSLSSLKTGGK